MDESWLNSLISDLMDSWHEGWMTGWMVDRVGSLDEKLFG